MLINWRSASDSEVTPMAFKQLGLGRSSATRRRRRSSRPARYALINGGIDPHAGLARRDLRPDEAEQLRHQPRELRRRAGRVGREHAEDELKGFDRELQAAVDEALRMLKEGKWQFTTTTSSQEAGK